MPLSPAVARTLLVCLSFVAAANASGKTVKVPDVAPQVVFDIPDEWTVTKTPLGFDLAPPDNSALIVSGLVKRDRASLTNWQKQATQRMADFGVAFDAKAKKPIGGFATSASTSVFSGAPSIGTPEQGPQATTAFEDKSAAGLPLEELTGRAPQGAKISFNGLIIYGASYKGTPVDAEFLNFALSPKELFLMQQESGKTDDRIAAIIDSVRRADK